jgi:hypothetical protein
MLDSPGTMRGEPVSTIKSMPKANGSGVDAEVGLSPSTGPPITLTEDRATYYPHLLQQHHD